MTNVELLEHILRLYREAEDITDTFRCEGISRGRRHTISSLVEDAVARMLYDRLDDQSLEVWVDYGLSFDVAGQAKRKTMYPDIAFVRRQGTHLEVLAIVDVKMDLGFRRNKYAAEIPKIAEKVRQLKQAHLVKRRVRNGDGWSDREGEEVLVSPKLLQCFAVISDQNMGRNAFQIICEAVAKQTDSLRLYTFTTGKKYLGYATRTEVSIQDDQINELIETLKSLIYAEVI